MTDAELERIAEQRLALENKQAAPAPKPSREQWMSYNPGGDYDVAMKDRDASPMVVEAENDFAETQAKLLAAEKKLALDAEKGSSENVLERNRGLAEVGALAGAAAQYKGVGQDLFRPSPDLFTPRDANMPGAQATGVSPAASMSDVEHTMQSGQGQRPGETGRSRENTHNQETQRQALATKEGLQAPGAAKVIVDAGPMYTTNSGIPIPKSAAVKMEEELKAKEAIKAEERRQLLEKQAIEQRKIDQQKANRAKVIGGAKGAGYIGQGVIGGALAGPQLYEYSRDVMKGDKNKPADTTQGLSGLGALLAALGKGRAGVVGGLAQLPYMFKHSDEIARSMSMSDINPTAFAGMPDEMSPAFPQSRPRPIDVTQPGPPREMPR